MKNVNFNLVGFAIIALVSLGCTNEETPEINPIIGEWVAADEQFLKITVDGQEKSPLEFGMEVFKLNEVQAEQAAKDYFQQRMLGPIDIQAPKIVFLASEKLKAFLSDEEIEGSWKFLNESAVLNLTTPDLDQVPFSYNVKKLTKNELYLDLDFEVTYFGEGMNDYQVELEIKLVK